MAIEFVFEMGAPATADQVGAVMTSTAATYGLITDGRRRFDREGAFLTSGIWAPVTTPSPLPFPHPVELTFGFAPVINVLFRMNKGGDEVRQDRDMVRLVVDTLAVVPGDALLTFNGELTLLRRHDGRLTVDADVDLWTPDLVALLPPPDSAVLPNL